MATSFQQVRSIFLAVLEKPRETWDGYLAQACGADAQLRAEVDLLLDAHLRHGGVLDEATRTQTEPPTDRPPGIERPGTIIAGRYKLLESLGEGGMGTVWVAEQTQPVRRKVALKLIRSGMDSRTVLARFEAERQALAMMDHPNIAKVLDGGLTESGRPYFVMEYVKGIPITEYCDAARLSVPQRLELFTQVCEAVQHAHQKGIIHRDLKPSNILVAPYDDKAVPKVIDFGLAKAIHQSLTEKTLHTAHEIVLGTPLYMSPEQAQLNNLDVDTRSDIYSLGVVLYELLTGTTPLEKQRLKEAAWDEVRRLIREEEPPPPSTRLSSAQTLPSLSIVRQTEPAKLTKLVRGELDWIVMRALEKDRTRRYATANGLAMDVQRFLAGEPVVAAPPSASYRLRKFVTKHRAALTTTALVGLLVLMGAGFTTWEAVRARRAEGLARSAQADADARRAQAERLRLRAEAGEKLASDRLIQVDAQKKDAEREARIAQAVSFFLQNKLLGQADPLAQADALLRAGGAAADATENPTIRELLDRAARELAPERIDAIFPNQPLVQADILHTVGIAYFGVGEYEQAILFLQRSAALYRQLLGGDDPSSIVSISDLGLAYQYAGKLDLALPIYKETLKVREAKFGATDPETLTSMNNLAVAYCAVGKLDLALPLAEQTLKLARAKLGDDNTTTLVSMNSLAGVYLDAGKQDQALPLFQEALKLMTAKFGPDHPDTLLGMSSLANAYRQSGKPALAIPLEEEALKLRKSELGPDHPDTLESMNNLAAAYQDAGKLNLALPLYEQTLKLRKAELGEDHPKTLTSMSNLANAYRESGRPDLAIPLLEHALPLMKSRLGKDHPSTLICENNLAIAYCVAGTLDLAVPLFEETVSIQTAKLGPDHPATLKSVSNLAATYWREKQLDKSIPLFEETLKRQKATLGQDNPDTLETAANLGVNYKDAGRLVEALPLLEEGYRASSTRPKLRWVSAQLLDCYAQMGKTVQAAALAREMLDQARGTLPKDSPEMAGQLASLGYALLRAGAFTDADPFLRECLAIRRKTQPDDWATFNTQSMLGAALLGQKKYTQAEMLLVQGYNGMIERSDTIPAPAKVRLTEALQRLVSLYQSRGGEGDAEKAAKYRKLLDQRQAIDKPVSPQ